MTIDNGTRLQLVEVLEAALNGHELSGDELIGLASAFCVNGPGLRVAVIAPPISPELRPALRAFVGIELSHDDYRGRRGAYRQTDREGARMQVVNMWGPAVIVCLTVLFGLFYQNQRLTDFRVDLYRYLDAKFKAVEDRLDKVEGQKRLVG